VVSPSIETSYRRRYLVLAVSCLSVTLVVVSNMALNVALPSLGRDLHAGASSLAWIVDTYVLCFAGLLLFAGSVGDRFGRKGVLQCGLFVYTAGAIFGACSTNTWQLILARAVMGIGAAFVMPGTLSILATVFPPSERAKAIAIWASVAGGSVAVSITWSGAMLEHFWWGSIFLGMATISVVALAAGWFLLPTSRHSDEAGFDPVGALLSIVGVTALLYGFIQAPNDGWISAQILSAFAVGILGLFAFVAWERRTSQPMLDIEFLSERKFSFGSLSIATAYFALFGMYFVFTQYLQLVRGYSTLVAGLYALPAGLAQLASANLSKPLVVKHGFRRVLTGGLIASATGLLVLSASRTSSPICSVEVGLALLGLGIGFTMPPATGAIMSSLPPHKAGVGSAVNDLARELGGAFGIGVLGSLTLSHYRSNIGSALAHDRTGVVMQARAGLAEALTGLGGAHTDAGIAARDAYSSGLALGMVVGAAVVFAAALIVYVKLPETIQASVAPEDSEPMRPAAVDAVS
jgi:EmrB/QacA subfamily drug resistance transporter